MVWWLLAVVFGVLVLWRAAVGLGVARALPALLALAGFEGRISARRCVAVGLVASVGAWLPVAVWWAVLRRFLPERRRVELVGLLRATVAEVVAGLVEPPPTARDSAVSLV